MIALGEKINNMAAWVEDRRAGDADGIWYITASSVARQEWWLKRSGFEEGSSHGIIQTNDILVGGHKDHSPAPRRGIDQWLRVESLIGIVGVLPEHFEFGRANDGRIHITAHHGRIISGPPVRTPDTLLVAY